MTAVLPYGSKQKYIPKHELEILARHFLPQIQAFFESEEGRKEYEDLKAEQAALKAQTADKTA